MGVGTEENGLGVSRLREDLLTIPASSLPKVKVTAISSTTLRSDKSEIMAHTSPSCPWIFRR